MNAQCTHVDSLNTDQRMWSCTSLVAKVRSSPIFALVISHVVIFSSVPLDPSLSPRPFWTRLRMVVCVRPFFWHEQRMSSSFLGLLNWHQALSHLLITLFIMHVLSFEIPPIHRKQSVSNTLSLCSISFVSIQVSELQSKMVSVPWSHKHGTWFGTSIIFSKGYTASSTHN